MKLIDDLIQRKEYVSALKKSKKLFKDRSLQGPALQRALHCAEKLGDTKEIFSLYKKGISLFPNNDSFLQNYAGFCFTQKRLKDALNLYSKILKRHPSDGITLTNIAACYLHMNELKKSETYAQKALKTQNPQSNTYDILGTISLARKKTKEAGEMFLKALKDFEPSIHSAFNYLQYCETHNQLNTYESTYAALPNAIKHAPSILLQMAILYTRQQKYPEAEEAFIKALTQRENLDLQKQKKAFFEYGKLLDKIGNYHKALTCFTSGNEVAMYLDQNESENSIFDLIDLQDNLEVQGEDHSQNIVFVLGFPRTGTTLVDQILSVHSTVQTFEETSAINTLFTTSIKKIKAGETLNRIKLQQQFLDYYRTHYERDENKVLVDRSAPNITYHRFIQSVFPNAKIILLHRHPCDVAFSCFMQDFTANNLTREFYTLAKIIKLYDHTMQTLEENQNTLSLKYENLISDFEKETKALYTFLALEWSEDVKRFYETALNKDAIRTASYSQVTRPIYNTAVNRWKNYEDQFTPLMQQLEPWIKKFGYEK